MAIDLRRWTDEPTPSGVTILWSQRSPKRPNWIPVRYPCCGLIVERHNTQFTTFRRSKECACEPCAKKAQTRDKHHHWKGGRTKHNGYVHLLVDGKYIPEHRLVKEQQLGRKLDPEEHVHHKNGVKDDNRPENLVLCHADLHRLSHHQILLELAELREAQKLHRPPTPI